jgi:hypothetical protein
MTKTKGRPEWPPFRNWSICYGLKLNDVRCLGAFLAISHIKRDSLVFGESLETIALDLGKVNEYVRTIILLDEPKTLSFVEPFHCTFSHLETPSLRLGGVLLCIFVCRKIINHSTKACLSGFSKLTTFNLSVEQRIDTQTCYDRPSITAKSEKASHLFNFHEFFLAKAPLHLTRSARRKCSSQTTGLSLTH